MSSEERGMATSAQPSWPGVSGWESIFAAMVEVPSLDSDEGSLSEGGDEELQIFQRDDICFMTDLSEELLDKEGSEEIPNEDVAEGFRKETLSIVTSPLHGRDEFTSGTPTDKLKSPVENNGKPYRELHLPARNTLCKEDRGHVDAGFELPDGKDGSFSSINKKQVAEHWDPDRVFQKLIEMGTDHVLPDMDLERTWDPELPPPPLPLFESYSARRQEEIMKQLADLNARQSQAVPGSWRLAPETEGHVRGGESSSRTSFPQKDLDVTGGKRCHQQTPTVYIDLRTATSSADATSLGHLRSGASTRVIRKADKTLPNTSTLTGKSLLLHQLRHMKNIPAPETPETKPQKMASAGGNAADPSPASQTQRKGRRESTSKDAPSVLEKPEAREVNRGVTTEERTREETRLDLNLHPSPTKLQEPPCSEDLEHKEKEEKQKQDRRRMQIQLEKLKPLRSVNTHQPMAEATPVLFHPDVSYGPDVRTLPAASCSIAEMVLLTVRLTSSGQVIVPGYHGCRSPDSTRFSVNAYNSLLTWLLSLVLPLNPHHAAGAPFQVLGLQQVWLEEGLSLFACLSPQDMSMQSSPKIRKIKGKGDLRGTSTFYQEALLYLKQNTLQSVTWWADEVAQRVEGQLFPLRMEIPPVKLSKIVSLNPALEAVERAFSPSSGFYWQTLETEEKLSPLDLESDAGDETQVVSVTLFDSLLRDPVSFHHVLHLILTKGLDVCGLRLLYPEAGIPCACTDPLPPSYTRRDAPTPPVLALALRGCRAGEAWGDLSGPCDPQLARMTDPYSVHALYGSRRDDPILQAAQGSARLVRGLSLWFGGRISDSGGNVNIGIQNPAERRAETCRPPALLTGTVMGDVFLVVSPAVPPMAYGDIIDVCRGRGFTMLGVRRLHLTARRVSILSMSPKQVPIYCPCKPSAQLTTQPCPRAHSLLLLLRKENAGRHVPGLLCGLMNGLAEQGLLGPIRTHFSQPSELDTDMCFHAAPYSDGLMQSLGGSLYAVPDPMSATMDMLTARPLPSDPENEQVVILTMTGRQTLKRAGHLLRQILRPCQKSSNGYDLHRFELLGLKWLPSLSRPQAKEITPYEVGDRPWQKSVMQLTSNPALLCALRSVRAFVTLERVIRELAPNTDKMPPQLIMSTTPEIAFRQAALIFTDKELISDPESRHMLKYIAPLSVNHKHGGGGGHEKQTESLFSYMLSGSPLLYTVLLLKPGIWSHNIGKILRKMEFQKFHLVGMKAVALTPMDCGLILPDNVTQDGLLFHSHREYLISGPSLVLCLQRHNAVLKLLDLLGPEDPQLCKAEDQFLWRAQYGTSIVRNGMYGSSSYSDALRDLKHFFPEGLPCQDSIVLESEQIPKLTRDVLFDSRAWRRATRNPLHQPGRTPAMDGRFISALGQTTCLVFPPCTMHGSPPHYIHGVEQLTGRDFRVTGARLTVFDHFQAQYVADLYNPTDGLSAELKALMDGPCLLIAAQRDNAVSCFNSLMESIIWQNSPNQSFPPEVLRPKTETQANKMITGFFDSLTPDSIHQIVHQTT